jgi:hypothetical protein
MSDNPQHASTATRPHSHSHDCDEMVLPGLESCEARAPWIANEQQVLPENRLWIVSFGLMCCIFLAALDQVSTIGQANLSH